MPSSRHLVDPALMPLLDRVPHIEMSADTLPSVRARRLPPAGDLVEAEVTDHFVTGRSGEPAVRVTVYAPLDSQGKLPGILHFHGGGFVAGRVESGEVRNQMLASSLQCRIVSVDYRLAPENPYPAALRDGLAVLDWMFGDGAATLFDTRTIGLMGESAGGGLAAALALCARDEARHRLAFLHLTYPMLDDRTGSVRPADAFTGEFVWTADDNRFGWSSLLAGEPGGADVSAYAAPARASDLAGLPPAFIGTGALDLFAGENIDFARRLLLAGVPAELHVYPGAFHGFDLVPTAAVAERARRDAIEALGRFVGSS